MTVRVAAQVVDALRSGQGVVALETAVVTHGLPRTPMKAPPCAHELLGGVGSVWRADLPANLALPLAMAAVVRGHGALPATIGMLDGHLIIGLEDDELTRLAAAANVMKLSGRDIAIGMVRKAHGGTTVAGTLQALMLARRQEPMPIRVFATGGIGGVHRGWSTHPDVSADLAALATTPACVVSAGAKSILDLAATVEALDSLGIPVLGLGTDWFPRFLTEGTAPLAVQHRVDTVDEAAAICATHWGGCAARTGVLLANPPPARYALPVAEIESLIEASVAEAAARGVTSSRVTPFLLSRLAEATGGRSVDANIAALLHNAQVAARLAATLRDVG